MMIIFWEPATLAKEPQSEDHKVDFIIKSCSELLDIFPPRQEHVEAASLDVEH